VFTIAPLSNMDYDLSRAARELLPVHVSALVALGRASAADSLIARYDRYLVPALRMRLAQLVATAWVRAGNVPRARDALRAAGPEADSTEAAGWLALYEGRLAAARSLLKSARDANAELALAMGIVARAKGDDAPELGAAFLTLARGDSAGAATKFIAAAQMHPEVAPALLLTAARLRGTQPSEAMKVWERIVADHAGTPEAAESELEWARALRRLGDTSAAAAHLEHLILSAPQSALLPQARRELELTRGTIPQT
jgi:tetratricopeptide (TPR) repeat protein